MPHSNTHNERPRPQSSATQYGLSHFAPGPILWPNAAYLDYNEDLYIDHYILSPRSFSGAKRKGVAKPFPDRVIINRAMKASLGAAGFDRSGRYAMYCFPGNT